MKKVLGMMILCFTLCVSSVVACGVKDRIGFNIGSTAIAVDLVDGKGNFQIDRGIVDVKGTIAIDTATGRILVSIPSKGVRYTGEYSGIERCLNTSLEVIGWDDAVQEKTRIETRFEFNWLAQHKAGSFDTYRNNGFTLYVAKEAAKVITDLGFILSPTRSTLDVNNGNPYSFTDNTDANRLVFIDYDKNEDKIFIRCIERDGDIKFYRLKKNGDLIES